MKRRKFFTLLAGAATASAPLAAMAQELHKLHRVGFLSDSPVAYADAIEVFRRGLRKLGWIVGRKDAASFAGTSQHGTKAEVAFNRRLSLARRSNTCIMV
jgi:hypothetical protein